VLVLLGYTGAMGMRFALLRRHREILERDLIYEAVLRSVMVLEPNRSENWVILSGSHSELSRI